MDKPKKERKFFKSVGRIAGILLQEFILGLGKKYIGKVINKVHIGKRKELLILTFVSLCSISLFAQYPATGNKQRLGYQTTADGLVWRGSISDTATIQPTNLNAAWVILDTVNLKFYSFDFTSNAWNQVTSGGGGSFTQPIDSLFFKTSVTPNNEDTAKMRWDSEKGTVVLGMYDQVPNELGFKNFWLVKNQTGSTITKGNLVYANGTLGASGRLTVAKFIANGTIEAKLLLGITAHDLSNGEDGYVVSFGKIRKVNTDTFANGAILYPSPTVAGAWTDVEPKAPNIDMPIGFCINSSSNNGTIAIRVQSGYKVHEIQDVDTTGIDVNGGLIYNGSYFVASAGALATIGYVDSIASNFQDSIDAITNGYYKQQFLNVTSDTLIWTKNVQLPTNENLLLAFRNGQILNDAQYDRIDTNKIKILSGSYKIGDNYTVVYVKGGGGSGSGGSSFDTTELNLQARLDLKLNISDTAAMLLPYATKAYADTSGRFYARQDFLAVTSSTLTWTQSDTLITGNSTVLQVYRNGQILLPTQYTVNSSTSLTISAAAYKTGENYTVIFPRGGGAGSGGGGSGSLISISGGTGITVLPNPITTTGTVSADLNVLMELNDTVSLSNRINTKLSPSDTVSLSNRINLKFNTSDTTNLNLISRFAAKQNTLTLTTSGTSGAATLTGATLNIPQYSGGSGGSGTVTSVATGYGLSGGTITTSGTLLLDSATVFNRIRDSIVDVAIGNDTIKILKQEYNNVSSSVLNWTVTSKFPIQLKAYILVFRNGQLLLNDQYNLTDTAQITLTSASYKAGENYTVVTVSGIGSVGSAQGNPIYPEAGIAVSTGTTWTTSIANNSTNWNTAYTDRLKWDGGSTGLNAATGRTSLGGTTIGQSMFTLSNPMSISFPRFNADNTVTSLSASDFRTAIGAGVGTVTSVTAAPTLGNPLSIQNTTTTPTIELLSATSGRNGYLTSTDWSTFNGKQNALNGTGFIKASGTTISYDNSTYLTTSSAASTYQTILTNPVTGTGTSGYLPKFTGTSTINNSLLFDNGTNLGIGTTNPTGLFNLISSKSTNSFLDTLLNISHSFTGSPSGQNVTGINILVNTNGDANTGINSETTTARNTSISIKGKATNSDVNASGGVAYGIYGEATASGSGTSGSTYAGYFNNTSTVGGNHYGLFVNTASGGDYGIYQQGTGVNYFQSNTSIGGTLGVTGATTLSDDLILQTSGARTETAIRHYYAQQSRYAGEIRFRSEGSSGSKLSFLTNLSGYGQSERMTITENGDVGINTPTPSYKLNVNGTLGVVNSATFFSTLSVNGATTLSSTLAVTGNITEGGNNVMTNLDTVSLSNRINLKLNSIDTASLSNRINTKVGLSGNETIAGNKTLSGNTTLSGTVTMSSTSGTPTSLLGKNASNVVNTVTSVNQTGVIATGTVINNTTDSNGYIVISISLSFTPTAVFANIDNVNDYIINVTDYSSIDIAFHIKNVSDGSDANVKTIPKFTWIAVR